MEKRESGESGTKRRSRAISLNLDWDNIVKLTALQQEAKGDFFLKQTTREFLRPTENFLTGSSYTGTWNKLGMAGSGTYTMPYGVVYEGDMADGMFHGKGKLIYPMGEQMDGIWENGRLVSFKFVFEDGLEYTQPWLYCQEPDRRFNTCILERLQPATREYLTNEQPSREIPEKCFDTGDGFYNPMIKCVVSAIEPKKILRNIKSKHPKHAQPAHPAHEEEEETEIKGEQERAEEMGMEENESSLLGIPTEEDEAWIMANCRREEDVPTGYRPDLYKLWTSGKEEELQKYQESAVFPVHYSRSIRRFTYTSIESGTVEVGQGENTFDLEKCDSILQADKCFLSYFQRCEQDEVRA